ncbi:hypothetical protein ARNL5_00610 [Anaerolineae bacterium]|nr:hypothetical protein ARNL5_00610 [Anaerolineae bacterium]
MSDLHLYDEIVQEATVAYGNKSLIDYSAIGESDDEVWNRRNRLFPKPRKVPEDTFFLTAVSQEGLKAPIRPWTEKDNPFTQVDLLDSEEDLVKGLIFRIRISRSIPFRQPLANRLFTLFNDAKEEDPASLGISAGSLRNFYNFLRLHTNLKCPTISLTPDYNISASWRGEQKRIFSVHFLPNGDARFVIFIPNVRHPERQIRISGAVTTDILMETVASYHVCDWIS